MNEKPLVTFALFAYNQEKYIREAVKGAFAQTYSPLEIILSDDCSTDRTFEIIREMAASYQGPHKIILNCNDSNMGLGPHLFNVARMASGELFIAAAGDDVSFADRTHTTVSNWLQIRSSVFTTDEEHYDEAGTYIGYFKRNMMSHCTMEDFASVQKSLGCTWAITRDLMVKYPIPSRDMINEDVLLGVIAMLHSGVSYIPVATVKRTTGVGITSVRNFKSKIEEKIVWLTRRVALLEAIIGVLRTTDDNKTLLLVEEDLKAIITLLDYARTGKSFFKTLAYVTRNQPRKYISNIFKILIFRWMKVWDDLNA